MIPVLFIENLDMAKRLYDIIFLSCPDWIRLLFCAL